MKKLPVAYICNNNQYAYSTPFNLQLACTNEADRGPAYNMPAEIVDGPDVLAVYEANAARRSLRARRQRTLSQPRREVNSGDAPVSPGVKS